MSYRKRHHIPDLGVGVGFRQPHYAHVLEARPAMDWFEIISENFMVAGGRPLANLARLRAAYPVVPHGVSLAIGSTEPLDEDYLRRLRGLVDRLDPPWVSDHLCWGRAPGVHLHELLPLPSTRAVLEHVVERVKRVVGALERPFALENASSYLTYQASSMPEWELLAEVATRADCGVLLDCNNVYVAAKNHGFDAERYIDAIPADHVVQIHLAGHTDKGTYLLDTHASPVCDEVWALYRRAIARCGAVATLVEWDDDIPAWSVLSAEAEKARAMRAAVLATAVSSDDRRRAGHGGAVSDDLRHDEGLAELARQQAALADAVRGAVPLGAPRVLELVAGNDRLSAAEQLAIYREQYFLRHVDVLREDFRSLHHLLGEADFERLARGYLADHPPRSFTLRDLGHAMAEHVRACAPWSNDPLLFDLARVEWAFVEAFDAADAPPLVLASLASIPEDSWPLVRLVLDPAVQRLALAHPAHTFRLAVRAAEDPARPAPAASYVVVYRGSELDLRGLEVEPDAFALLDELARGAPLGEACEGVAARSGTSLEAFQAQLGAWFQQWTALGWVSRAELG